MTSHSTLTASGEEATDGGGEGKGPEAKVRENERPPRGYAVDSAAEEGTSGTRSGSEEGLEYR